MFDFVEDIRNEFKIKITDKFEKEVISFLNTEGGNIFIGIKDNGEIVGLNCDVDLLQRTIKDRIKFNIMPSTLGLFDVIVNESSDKKYIQIVIAKGQERPYYLKGMGMSPDSCFIRIGSSIESMTNEIIFNLFSQRTRNSLRNIVSPNQNLEFSELKIFYQEQGFITNDNFLKQLNLYDENNKYNYIAYLLSDNNNVSIQFAKYKYDDVYELIENEDYGFCSLIKATNNILNKLNLENKTYVKLDGPIRKEIKLYNYNAIKELVTNAFVHNDWSNGYSPKFEIFANKLVISSNGGVQEGVTQEEFLKGFSNPRNPELMRVFRDLKYVEQLGTGIQRVLKIYDKDIFEFFPNHIRATIYFNENEFLKNKVDNYMLEEKESALDDLIIKLILEKPNITQKQISEIIDSNIRTIKRHFKFLIDNNYIERIGPNKNGSWEVRKR